MSPASLFARVALAALALWPVAASAQSLYATPSAAADASDPAEQLARYLRILAASPRDLSALTGAGRAALAVGDASAALSFFARADAVSPRSGPVKAGLATALVQMEQPREAMKLFEEAVGLGVPEATIASDRGLARDLSGDGRRAQADYALALRNRDDPETIRRYALSLAIAGDKGGALTLLDPLLRRQDKAAWRVRAFVLALTGDQPGAERAAEAEMPRPQALAMAAFFGRLPGLRPAEKAAAVNFGHFPASGRRYSDAELFASAAPTGGRPIALPSPELRADAPLIPSGLPLGGREGDGGGRSVFAGTPAPDPLARAPRRRPGVSDETLTAPPPVRIAQAAPKPAVSVRLTPAQPARVQAATAPTAIVTAAPVAKAVIARTPPATVTAPPATPMPQPVATAAITSPPPMPAPRPPQPIVIASATPPPAPAAAAPLPAQPSAPAPGFSFTAEGEAAPVETVATAAPDIAPPAPAAPAPGTQPADDSELVATTPVGATAPHAFGPPASLADTPPPASAPAPTRASAPEPAPRPAPRPATVELPVRHPAAVVSAARSKPAAASDSVLSAPLDHTAAGASRAGRSKTGAKPAQPEKDTELALLTPKSRSVKARPDSQADEVDIAKPAKGRGKPDAKARHGDTDDDSAPAKPLTKAEKAKADAKPKADTKAKADAEAKRKQDAQDKADALAEAKAKKSAPERYWVQVASGANRKTLGRAWDDVKGKSRLLAARTPWTTPWHASNRVLVGPFKSDEEAQAFVNTLGKQGLSGIQFTSRSGVKVDKLGAE